MPGTSSLSPELASLYRAVSHRNVTHHRETAFSDFFAVRRKKRQATGLKHSPSCGHFLKQKIFTGIQLTLYYNLRSEITMFDLDKKKEFV